MSMPLDSSVWRRAEIVSSAHGQQAFCACLFGSAAGMSFGIESAFAGVGVPIEITDVKAKEVV